MERMAAGVVDNSTSVLVVSPLIGDALFSVRELDTPRVAKAPRHWFSRRREPSGLKFNRCLRPRFGHAEQCTGVFAVGPTRVEDRVPDEAAVDRPGDRVRPWLAVAPSEVERDPHTRQWVSALIDRRDVDHLRHRRARRGDLRRNDGKQPEDDKGRSYVAAHAESLTQADLRCLGVEVKKTAMPSELEQPRSATRRVRDRSSTAPRLAPHAGRHDHGDRVRVPRPEHPPRLLTEAVASMLHNGLDPLWQKSLRGWDSNPQPRH
jgi:hypothetical protein